MKYALWLSSLLFTTLLNDQNVQAYKIRDKDASFTKLVEEVDVLKSERTGLDLILGHHLNLTKPGRPRGARRNFPRANLELRQSVSFPSIFNIPPMPPVDGLGRALMLTAASSALDNVS